MRSDSDLPKAWPSLWRTFRLGYRAEPRLLALSLTLALLMMIPDALLALWLSSSSMACRVRAGRRS